MKDTTLREKLMDRLVDSQRQVARVQAAAREIQRAADKMERDAIRDLQRLRRDAAARPGPRGKIARAEYFEALDRRRRASQVGVLARRTLARL